MLVKSITASGYSADESAAVEAVTAYDAAWQSADCEAFEATTTEELRTELSLADCAAFEEASAGFQDVTDDYELAVTDVTTASGVITVRTDETYTSYQDDDGSTVPGFDAHLDHRLQPRRIGRRSGSSTTPSTSTKSDRMSEAPPRAGMTPRFILTCIGIGLGAGLLSGLFGVGGGTVIVPAARAAARLRPAARGGHVARGDRARPPRSASSPTR